MPLFLINKDTPIPKSQRKSLKFLDGYKEIIQTFKDMKQYKAIFTFMIAYFFLNDAIATTIAMMAVYATTIVGFSSDNLSYFIWSLLSQQSLGHLPLGILRNQ